MSVAVHLWKIVINFYLTWMRLVMSQPTYMLIHCIVQHCCPHSLLNLCNRMIEEIATQTFCGMPSKTIITGMYENIFQQTSPSFIQIFLTAQVIVIWALSHLSHTHTSSAVLFLSAIFFISFLIALNFSVVHECILPPPCIVPQNILHCSGHPTFLMGVLLAQTCHLQLEAMDFASLIRNVSHTVEPW